jgi:hypothetical protein
VSERRACRVLGQARTTQRHVELVPDDEDALTARSAVPDRFGLGLHSKQYDERGQARRAS